MVPEPLVQQLKKKTLGLRGREWIFAYFKNVGLFVLSVAHSRPQSPNFFFLIVERGALGPSKNIFFFIGCPKPYAQ